MRGRGIGPAEYWHESDRIGIDREYDAAHGGLIDVLVTGGTGYMGKRLIALLVDRGHRVRALVRAASVAKLPGIETVVGDALSASDVAGALRGRDTLVHLVGTPHPNPAKAAEFRYVDLASIRAGVAAAKEAGLRHLVYVSVAHPAPAMHAYVEARAAGEAAIAEAGLSATILRPWYVLGPGHRWPVVLVPLYALAKVWPGTRETALRLDLVGIDAMTTALAAAVESPPSPASRRIVEVPAIKRAQLSARAAA